MGKEERKILFVTVGTSALSARLLGSNVLVDAKALRKRCSDYLEDVDGREADEVDLFQDVLDVHRTFWRKKRAGGQVEAEGTSAEMTSTSLLMRTDPEGEKAPAKRKLLGGFNKDQDSVVLLASDTPEGRLCANLNARLMCEFLVGCKCGTDCETCKVVVWPGLEARNKEFHGIADELRRIVVEYKNGERTLYFNITGGYKAAIPSVTYLCWDLRPTIPMFNQHVSHSSIIRLEFLPSATQVGMRMHEEVIYVPDT